jgi:hypothetical protein
MPRPRDACMAPRCRSTGAMRCSYVDKRSRRCTTTWCSRHWVMAMGRSYCRRHASTVEAVAGGDFVEGLPDIDNRAPSLVGWVSGELDQSVRLALLRLATPASHLVVDPVRLIPVPVAGRRWQRSWKLVDHQGILNRVTIEVDESDDSDVRARVDMKMIGHGVPPWIERRRQGVEVTAEVDQEQRRAFREGMARSIELVVTHQEMVPHY